MTTTAATETVTATEAASATTFPPHGRLLIRLTALGPYLRKKKSNHTEFFFDCLASCVNADKEPSEREFWGWWLVLTTSETGFEYSYDFGRYALDGEWHTGKLPAKHKEAVLKTLVDFHNKLSPFIVDECELTLVASDELKQMKLTELS